MRAGRRRAAALVGLVAALAGPGGAGAQPGIPSAGARGTPAELLGGANDALAAGDPAGAATLATRALERQPSAADRTEAHRVLGLARFFLGDRAAAEAAFVEYLVLDAEAHLDPTLVPPEAIVFFEDVRARHATELAARRPRPGRRRSPWLAPLPIYGQVQNGDRGKAWVLGSAGLAMLAVNLGTYLWLRAHCHDDGTCYRGPDDPSMAGHEDLTGAARDAQFLNWASAATLAGITVFAVIDGVRVYRRETRREDEQGFIPQAELRHDGFGLSLARRF